MGISGGSGAVGAAGFGPEYAAEACLACADRASFGGSGWNDGDHAPSGQEQADGLALAGTLDRVRHGWADVVASRAHHAAPVVVPVGAIDLVDRAERKIFIRPSLEALFVGRDRTTVINYLWAEVQGREQPEQDWQRLRKRLDRVADLSSFRMMRRRHSLGLPSAVPETWPSTWTASATNPGFKNSSGMSKDESGRPANGEPPFLA